MITIKLGINQSLCLAILSMGGGKNKLLLIILLGAPYLKKIRDCLLTEM